jgi:leader peptidase (prepilin peptidase)/N-methyltransferase
MTFLFLFLVFIFGLAIGSFLNVCIYRLPSHKSLIRPGSHCPACGTPIKPYDNIPLLSYLFLLGRCRHCKVRISLRYPAVELLTGVLFVALAVTSGLTVQLLISCLLVSSLIVITFIDLDLSIIPDRITVSGMIVGLLCSFFNARLGSGWSAVLTSGIGLFVGGVLYYVIAVLGSILFKKESMGGGDIKLAAMLGAFLGWKGILLTSFFAFFLGAIIGGIVLLASSQRSHTRIPFGPFLAMGAVVYIFSGDFILNAYWQLATS